MAKSYHDISASWINQGTLIVDESGKIQPYISLIVVCHSEDSSQTSCVSFGVDLLSYFDNDYNLKLTGVDTPPSATRIDGLGNASQSGGGIIYSAPDGTMLANYVDTNSKVRIAKLQLNGITDSKDVNYGKPGLYNPEWQTYKNDPDGGAPGITTHNTSCTVFIPLLATISPSPCPIIPSDGSDKKIYEDCPTQKYIQCIFSSGSGNIPQLSTFYWGTLFGIPNYIISDCSDEYKEKLLLSMTADTFPYPVPQVAVWGSSSPSGMINWLLCTYEYLVGDDTEVDIDSNLSAAIGFKAEAIVTAAGIGVQGDDSLSSGFSTIVTNSDTVHQATSYSVISKGLPNPDSGDNVDAPLRISTEGVIFGTGPAGQLGVDVYAVLLRGDDDISGPLVSAVHPVLDSLPTTIAGEYETYCYTPGNLLSYTENAINTKMGELFNSGNVSKADFVINGEDFSKFYEGDYIDNIVKRFGSNTFGPSKNLPYLEFSFSETGVKRSEFQSTSSFTCGGSAFVNGSSYFGLAVNEEEKITTSLLGFIGLDLSLVQSTGYAMVGAEFSTSLTTTNSTSDSWGIKLGEYLNPLAPGEAYTVRMYFLKPSPLWARELKYFGLSEDSQAKMDLINSSPIRILFTVSYISDALHARLNSMY